MVDSIWSYLRQTNSIGLEDLPLFLKICALAGIFRFFLTYLVIGQLAKHINFKNEKIRFKFTHRGYDCIHYWFSTITGFLAILQRPYYHCFYWTFNCGEEFLQQVEPTDRIIMSGFEKFYYMIFTAYYMVDFFFIWTNSADKKLLVVHHFTTISLILISIYIRTGVIGVNVMLLHDIVDAPLYLGKVCTYLEWKTMQDVSLLVFAATCTWFRMICLPGVIVNGVLNISKRKPDHYGFYLTEGAILLVLMYCHIYWFKRIVMSAINIFTKGKDAICDNRSDDATNHIE